MLSMKSASPSLPSRRSWTTAWFKDSEGNILAILESATNIVGRRTSDDRGRTTVHRTIPHLSRLVVRDIVPQDNAAVERRRQTAKSLAIDRRGCTHHVGRSTECSNTTPAS